LQEEILKSLEDVRSGPLGSRIKVLKGQNEEEKEAMSKARESHLVVAALIATVTFAAAFTLPGGYKNDQGPNEGTAILVKKAAFIVFVISDAMSMVLSILAVFIHFLTAFIQGFEMEKNKEIDEETIEKLFGVATLLTMIGMGTSRVHALF
jgi:cytochrome bd-type quinol oxidase subunit 2